MKKTLFILAPFFYIFFVWFIFASPFFLFGKVPYPGSYQVNNFYPWSQYREFWGPIKNAAMPDVISQMYPWKSLTITSLQNMSIPYWNPYSFSGTPHLANFQSAVFSPFNSLFFIFPFTTAWSILILLQPLIAGVATYLLLKEYKVSKISSLVGSICFMFCGFIVVWMAYGTLSLAISLLPAALYVIEKLQKHIYISYCIILSLLIAVSFYSGHFQTSLYLLLFIIVYTTYNFVVEKNKKTFLYVIVFIALGVIFSFPQLFSTAKLYFHSSRQDTVISENGIPLPYIITAIVPDFYGNPVTRNDWFGYYAEWASFVGIIPFVLALFTIFSKNKKTKFYSISTILFLLLALNSPLQKLIAALHIPFISSSSASRVIVLFSFSIAILSGFGLDTIIKNSYKSKRNVFILLTIFTVGIMLLWTFLFNVSFLPEDKSVIAKRNLILPTVLFIMFLLFYMFRIITKNKYVPIAISFLILVFVTFDSTRFAKKWMPFDDARYVFPQTKVISAIKNNIGQGRVYGNIGAHVDTYYNLPAIEGYEPLHLKRYSEFIHSASTGKFTPANKYVVTLDRKGKNTDKVLDLLGVTIIFHPLSDTKKSWAYPVWEKNEKYKKVFQDESYQLFFNKSALPRAKMYYSYEVLHDDRAIIERFYSKDFDSRSKIILEEDPAIAKYPISVTEVKNNVVISSYTGNKVTIKVESEKAGLLFLSDAYYPSWRVTVNGKREKILRADYSFRAVKVPSGISTVVFYYNEFF